MRRFICGILLLLTALVAVPAAADDAALGRMGETVYPLQETQVRMASEKVSLRVTPDRTFVDVTFVFTNDGPAREILMGFPVGRPYPAENSRGDAALHDFRSWIDGQEVAVKQEQGIQPAVPRKHENGHDLAYPSWITFTVPFAEGQTRTVRNTYWGTNSFWSNGDVATGYVLQTGRTWKGPIGSAVVTLEFEGVEPWQLFSISPTTYRWERNRLTWQFSEFEPSRDIVVRHNARPQQSVLWEALPLGKEDIALLEEARRSKPNPSPDTPDELDLALMELHYRFGDRHQAKALADQAIKAQVPSPLAAYIAAQEGLATPGSLLEAAGVTPVLRRYLMDRAGISGAPPARPSVTLHRMGDEPYWRAEIQLEDADADLDDWGIAFWLEPDEQLEPAASATGMEMYGHQVSYRQDLYLTELGEREKIYYRAWAVDGRGHRSDTGLVEAVLPGPPEQTQVTPEPPPAVPAPPAPEPESPSPGAPRFWAPTLAVLLGLLAAAWLGYTRKSEG